MKRDLATLQQETLDEKFTMGKHMITSAPARQLFFRSPLLYALRLKSRKRRKLK